MECVQLSYVCTCSNFYFILNLKIYLVVSFHDNWAKMICLSCNMIKSSRAVTKWTWWHCFASCCTTAIVLLFNVNPLHKTDIVEHLPSTFFLCSLSCSSCMCSSSLSCLFLSASFWARRKASSLWNTSSNTRSLTICLWLCSIISAKVE